MNIHFHHEFVRRFTILPESKYLQVVGGNVEEECFSKQVVIRQQEKSNLITVRQEDGYRVALGTAPKSCFSLNYL